LICDTIEFVRATSNKDVNNDETGINPFRILVADNDRSVLKLYREALSRVNAVPYDSGCNLGEKGNPYRPDTFNLTPQSFDVITCQRADEAVDAVKDSLKHGRPFSVFFTDINISLGPDGFWAVEQIRKLDPDMEIVIMTGYTDIHPHAIACQVPPAHKLLCIQKPLQSHEIYQFAFVFSMKWHAEYRLQEVHKKLEACVEEQIREFKKVTKKFDEIIKSVEDDMIMIDKTYRIVFANHRAKKVFGENMVGKKCHKLYYEREKPCEHCMAQKTFVDARVYEQDNEFFGKNGNKMIFRSISNVAEVYEDGHPKMVLIIHKDVTRLRQLEKELRKVKDEAVLKYKNKSKALSHTLIKLEEKEKDLERYKSNLEKLNKEMIETNRAVSVLARNINRNKELYENKIYETTTAKILPIIKELKNNKSCQRIMADLDVLETNVNSLFSVSDNHHEIINILTDQEMRVAVLIKRGLTSQKISNMLCISEYTVKG
jgi:PAS domain S-box-containing protein